MGIQAASVRRPVLAFGVAGAEHYTLRVIPSVQNIYHLDSLNPQKIAERPRMYNAVTKQAVACAWENNACRCSGLPGKVKPDMHTNLCGPSSGFNSLEAVNMEQWTNNSVDIVSLGALLRTAGVDLDVPLSKYFPNIRAACGSALKPSDKSCPENKLTTPRNDGMAIQVCCTLYVARAKRRCHGVMGSRSRFATRFFGAVAAGDSA